MTFKAHENGTKKRYCPATGEILTIRINKRRIIVDSNLEDSVYKKT